MTPLAHQLQERLRDAIRSGRLARGERLPASRALAAQLGVSRGVVVDTYAQLESEGYLLVGAGLGDGGRLERRRRPGGRPAPRVTATVRRDFEYGVPDLRSFPMRDWLWAMGVAGRTATAATSATSRGAGATRCARCSPHTCAGCAERSPTPEWSSAPGSGTASTSSSGAARRAVSTHPRRGGPRPRRPRRDRPAFRYAGRARAGRRARPRRRGARASVRARAVVVTPAHQARPGWCSRRSAATQLVEWAHAVDGFVVEDDYDAEFRYDRQPVGAVQGLALDRGRRDGLDQQDPVADAAHGLAGLRRPPPRRRSASRSSSSAGGAPGSTSWPSRRSSSRGGTTGTCARCAASTRAGGRPWSRRWPAYAPDVAVTGLAAGCSCGAACYRPASTEEEVGRRCAASSVAVYGMSRYRIDRGDRAGRAGPGVRQRQGERHPRGDAPGRSGPASVVTTRDMPAQQSPSPRLRRTY